MIDIFKTFLFTCYYVFTSTILLLNGSRGSYVSLSSRLRWWEK